MGGRDRESGGGRGRERGRETWSITLQHFLILLQRTAVPVQNFIQQNRVHMQLRGDLWNEDTSLNRTPFPTPSTRL